VIKDEFKGMSFYSSHVWCILHSNIEIWSAGITQFAGIRLAIVLHIFVYWQDVCQLCRLFCQELTKD